MRQPQPTPPVDPEGLSAVALLLHTAVPAATDHPYRKHPSSMAKGQQRSGQRS